MIKKPIKNELRQRRHKRVRKKLSGTSEIPRLCVFRSNKHTYAQIIDDSNGTTLVAASTLEPEVKAQLETRTVKTENGEKKEVKGADKTAAKVVGQAIAKKALDKGIEKVVFDRGGYIYTGRVKELADGAREGGLKF